MSVPNPATIPDEAPFLDIADPGFSYHSAEVVRAQERSWYARSPIGYLVLRYAEAQDLLRDRRLDHNGRGYMEMNGITDGPIYDWFVPMIVNHDGEDHRRLRGLVQRTFTPRMINNLRPYIRSYAEELTDRVAQSGTCEFVEDFGDPLPLAVMCRLLGVPPEDYNVFRGWTTDIGLVFSLAHGGDIPARVQSAVTGLYGYVDALMDAKLAAPGDDLISALVTQHSADEASREELRNLIVTLVFAAHDTTRHQLANAMVAFSEHHQQWALLADRPDDPELVAQVVDEVMRWCPSVASVYRFAAEDLDYGGLHLQRGAFVMMCVLAAQRDPRAYENAGAFDITVPRRAPVLQFGAGPHHCLGNALARAEISEALPVLASRLGPPTVTAPFEWRPPIGIYGPVSLPLRFG